MRKSIAYLLFCSLCLFPGIASAVVTVYTDEASYLNALASLGHGTILESFEGVEWDNVRTPDTAPSVLSQGITWTTNHPQDTEITTSGGNVVTGSWGVYDSNHGFSTLTVAQCDVVNPPEDCFMHDGFSGSIPSPDLIYGVGGYITGTPGADVDIFIDGVAQNGGPIPDRQFYFMGVIDTEGFNTFEYRELEGQVEQQLFIFGDDFTIAKDGPVTLPGSLQFSATTYTVDENGTSTTITVTRTGGSSGTVGVDFASSDGSAFAGSDYTMVSGSLSFADGVLSQTFTVPILDDIDYEGDETVNLSLSNPTGGASLGLPSTSVLTITEDDPVPPAGSLQFSAATYTVDENAATATITVTRTDGSFGTVGVDYASSDGSATDGSDYTAENGSLSFTDGVLSQTFTIPLLDDVTYEGDETVNLTLSNPTGGAGLGSPATSVLTISEDDPVPLAGSLQFSTASYTESENGATATITVTRTGGSFGTVGVDYATSDASATAGSDYTAASGSLSFDDGVLSQTFAVTLLDDTDYEGDETVNLSLSNPTGGAGLGTPATAVLTVSEDDPVPSSGSLQFSAPTYTVAENGASVTIAVTRTGGSSGAVGVDYASSDGSATAGSDYTAMSGSLSFADGVLSQTFTVPILDDVTYEGDESVNLALSNPTGGAGLGSPATAVLTISEDDPVPVAGSLQFDTATYTVAENGATASITVTRTGGSSGVVGVDYATSDAGATAGSDYTAVSGSLSFTDGQLNQTFTVPILDDVTYEGDESVNLALSNPTGGAGLGAPATAVLTITEDDPVPPAGSLQFSAPTYTVSENGATATITVTRTGGSFGIVGVNYASSDASATAGSDYTAVSGSLSFADGELNQTFTVPILDDAVYEGDETLNLSLSNPTGGAGLGSPATASLTITEDETQSDNRKSSGSISLLTLFMLFGIYLRQFLIRNHRNH